MNTESWLAQCQGFRVDTPDGRMGVVEEVLEGADPGRVAALVVATGLFIPRSVLVPRESIVAVEPRRKRIVLDSAPPLRDSGLEDTLLRRARECRRSGRGERPVLGEIDTVEKGEVDVVALRGEHDLAGVSDLERSLSEVNERGQGAVVDLIQTTFLDSSVLIALADATVRAESGGRRLVVYGARSLVRRLIDLFELPIRLAATHDDAVRRAALPVSREGGPDLRRGRHLRRRERGPRSTTITGDSPRWKP